MVEMLDFGVPRARKIMKWMMFERSQHPQNQKLCGKRSISNQKVSMKKIFFFAEIIFSHNFSLFSTSQNPKFRDLDDPAMCPSLPIVNLMNFEDFEEFSSFYFKINFI